jgi:drug/metabolite transporter (DMT)-like permease
MATNAGQDVPASVKVIGFLAIIVGIVQIIGGVLMIVFNGDVNGYSSGAAVVFGIITLLVGAIYVWAGRGLINDDPAALLFCLLISGFKMVYDFIWLIALGIDGIGIGSLIALLINILVFALLWRARGAFGIDDGTTGVPPRTPPSAPAT